MAEIAVFHPDAARRLLANSREFETEQSQMDDQNRPVARPVYLVKVTGATDAANGGFYPCVRVDRNFDANTWEDDTTSAWLDARGSTIGLNKEVVAILAGVYAKDKTTEAKSFYVTAGVGGGGSTCPPTYSVRSHPVDFACDKFGSGSVFDWKHEAVMNGCSDNPFRITITGKVSDAGGAGVSGVQITSATSNPNSTPTTYAVIATTGAGGTYSGNGFLIVDGSNPIPKLYVSVKAAGVTAETKIYGPTDPATANFTLP